ncbi:hypothetical protein ES703_85731 [subsurface metagenome]
MAQTFGDILARKKTPPEAKAAVPILIKLLKDNDAEMRRYAAYALWTIGEDAKAAIPALRAAEKDADAKVRREAGYAIIRLDGGPDTGLFCPDTAFLCYAADGWLVWSIADEFGRYSFVTNRPCRLRYYLQKLGEKKAMCIYQYRTRRDPSSPEVITVLPDGTVLLYDHKARPYEGNPSLIWVFPDGSSKEQPFGYVNRAYTDGLIQSGDFIPISNSQLLPKQRISLTGISIPKFDEPGLLRHGHLIASGCYVFDLETKTRREIDLGRSGLVTAFDGETIVIDGRRAFSVSDGKELYTLPPSGSDSTARGNIVLVRNKIGYSISIRRPKYHDIDIYLPCHTLVLEAIDFTAKESKPVSVLEIPGYEVNIADFIGEQRGGKETQIVMAKVVGREIPMPHMILDEGFVYWDGRQWSIFKWLEEIPKSKM